jgi:hypothetical protein
MQGCLFPVGVSLWEVPCRGPLLGTPCVVPMCCVPSGVPCGVTPCMAPVGGSLWGSPFVDNLVVSCGFPLCGSPVEYSL